MSILALKNVSKSFGALKVTDDVSFEVPEGMALGIIGPNGAGKSTLFNLITGNISADSGTIEFLGRDVTRTPARQRCVVRRRPVVSDPATLFQADGLREPAGGGHIRTRQKRSRRVAHTCAIILERTELISKANTPAGGLSLLERKRLELARAMATHPKLLLLDEIAGGLTDAECQSLIETIKAIHAEGVTIIWIEHVLHALNSVVERLLVLDFGKVIGIGEPAAIMESNEVREIYLGIEI
jgi:branched-chain amino acid transport system ATP-binding protein